MQEAAAKVADAVESCRRWQQRRAQESCGWCSSNGRKAAGGAATSTRGLQVVAAAASVREMQVAVSATAELQVAVQQRSCSGTAGGGDSAGGAAVEKNTVALQVEQQYRIAELKRQLQGQLRLSEAACRRQLQ